MDSHRRRLDFPYAAQIGCIRRDVFDLDGAAISKESLWRSPAAPPNEPARPICTPT
jgi:hypothetical protein